MSLNATAAAAAEAAEQQIDALRAQLFDAQEQFTKALNEVKHERDVAQLELSAVKSDCNRISSLLDDAVVRANHSEENEHKYKQLMEQTEQDCKEKMEALRERQCDAPAIDEGIFRNYRDFRALLHARCGAEFMSVNEQWQYARSSPLAVLEKTREWIFKSTECFQIVVKQSDAVRRQLEIDNNELLGALELKDQQYHQHQLQLKQDKQNKNRSATAAAASSSSPATTPSKHGSSLQQQQQQQQQQNKSESQLQKEREATETTEELHARVAVLRREAALTKAELLRSHKATHVAEQRQHNLQMMLEKAHKQLHEAVEASSSATVRKQIDEINRTMRAAIASKDEEIKGLKRIFEKDVKAMNDQISNLNTKISDGDKVEAKLAATKEENQKLKHQLARLDIKSLEERRDKAVSELKDLRHHVKNLETENDEIKLKLAAAKQLADSSKQKYSQLFDAHLQEEKHRQLESARQKMSRIRREVVGSDSALTKYHFEQKYQALVAELASTQQKLKRLIMIAHHDQIAHEAEVEQMQVHATAFYEKQQRAMQMQMEQQQQQQNISAMMQYGSSSSGRRGNSPDSQPGGGGGGGGNSPGSLSLLTTPPRVPSSISRQRQERQQEAFSHAIGGESASTGLEKNLFSAHGSVRQQLQQNVVVSSNKATVEEISHVVGEGKVQDRRTWEPQMKNLARSGSGRFASASSPGAGGGKFEVSSRTAGAATVAKKQHDLDDYYSEREKQEQQRAAKKVSISTAGAHQGAKVGMLSSGRSPSSSSSASSATTPPPKSQHALNANSTHRQTPEPSSGSVQFFVEGSAAPSGNRNRKVL